MRAILKNTPKIKFLRIRFLRTALKSQHRLADVLQNRQELDLLIPEQGGTWRILNETCCFWVNTSAKLKKISQSSRKTFSPTGSQRTSLRVLRWLQSLFEGSFSWLRWTWSWPMPLLTPVISILIPLMIAPCIINCLIHFFFPLPWSTSYKMQC